MARLGAFDATLDPKAWFDAKVLPEGWFADELIPTPASGAVDVDYLIVAGGGGGGGNRGGGGGAGGVVPDTTTISAIGSFTVTVGAGGAGGVSFGAGGTGGNSSFDGTTAQGGGGGAGASGTDFPAGSGGSGGGGAHSGTPLTGGSSLAVAPELGNAGGSGGSSHGGGGGGAASAGSNSTGSGSGAGGDGYLSSINGTSLRYGAGGGGGQENSSTLTGTGGLGGGGNGAVDSTPAVGGTANTGSGGGGGNNANRDGAAGASGTVIIRYATAEMTATGGTITTVGADTVHTFNASGTFEVTAISGGGPAGVVGTGSAVAPTLTLDAPVASGDGSYTVAGITGTAEAAAPNLTLDAPVVSASGAYAVDAVTGTGAAVAPALTLDAPVAAGDGAYAIAPVTGTAEAIAPAITLDNPVASAAGALVSGLSGVSFTATKVGVDEAPQSVHFSATVTGIANQSDAIIVWDFGDNYEFRYLPNDTKANDRQSGAAIGHFAAHVYRAAGTYTVTCTAYEFTSSGVVSVITTQNVVIAATDAAITTRLAISKTGSFTGAPAGATQVNWSGGEPGSLTFDPNTAYYFEAGQTFNVNLNAANFSAGGVLKLHRYGSGANPILTRGFVMWGSNHGHTSVCEIEFRGTFDVNNNPNWEDTGVYPTPPTAPQETGIFLINGNGGQTALVYGVKVSGFQLNYYYQNNNTNTITHTVDCESTNWWNYGCLSGNDGTEAWVGCHFHQKVGLQGLPDEIPQSSFAWNSPGARNTPRSGPMRIGEGNPVLVNKCRLLAYRSGWSQTIVTDVAAIQPAIRLGSGTSAAPENAVLSQSDMIGGMTVLAANIQNTSTAQSAVNLFIIENNYLSQGLDGEANEFIGFTKPGAHIRNNIVEYVTGITPANTVGSTIRFVGVSGALSFGLDATSYVYGNTLVANGNTPSIDWQAATEIGSGARPITYQNNVIQMNGTFNSGGSSSLFQTNYNPLNTTFPFAPLAGSAAYQTYSTGRLPALARDGTPRVTPFSIGASEEGSSPSTVIGTGAAVAPALTLAATADGAAAHIAPVTGTAEAIAPALTLDSPTASASGEYVISGVTGTGSAVAPNLTLDAPVASASGDYVVAGVTGTAEATAPALTLAATADGAAAHIAPVTGTAEGVAPALTLDAPVATASGEYVVAGVTGTGAAVAPGLTLDAPVAAGTGATAAQPVEGSGAAVAPALTLVATASALGSYSDFVVFAPSLLFTVEPEQTVLTVEPEQTVFIVIQEAA
jgi:hypothetical protein